MCYKKCSTSIKKFKCATRIVAHLKKNAEVLQKILMWVSILFKMLFKDEILLPGYLQWDEDIQFAYNRHRNEKAGEVLDLAYEEYTLKADLRLYDTAKTESKIEEDTWRDYVKKGKQLAGEV